MPDNFEKNMSSAIVDLQKMMADQEFKKAIGHIELYKIRNGNYPGTLRDLEFLSPSDSSMFNFIEYVQMDSVYELNVNYPVMSTKKKNKISVRLNYPDKFWDGLGCVKSNAK